MQRCARTSSMNLRVLLPPEWLSQQQPFTTWLFCSTRRPRADDGRVRGAWREHEHAPAVLGRVRERRERRRERERDQRERVRVVDRHLVARVYGGVSHECSAPRGSCTWQGKRADERASCRRSRARTAASACRTRMNIARFSSSVANSSMPSMSWLPPMTSYGTPKLRRNSAAISWHAVVPAKSSAVLGVDRLGLAEVAEAHERRAHAAVARVGEDRREVRAPTAS